MNSTAQNNSRRIVMLGIGIIVATFTLISFIVYAIATTNPYLRIVDPHLSPNNVPTTLTIEEAVNLNNRVVMSQNRVLEYYSEYKTANPSTQPREDVEALIMASQEKIAQEIAALQLLKDDIDNEYALEFINKAENLFLFYRDSIDNVILEIIELRYDAALTPDAYTTSTNQLLNKFSQDQKVYLQEFVLAQQEFSRRLGFILQ